MTNSAPMYVCPADWTLASVELGGGLPTISRFGTYVTDQATLNAIVTAAALANIPLVYLKTPPMGFTQDTRLANPNAFYPTPALLAEYFSQSVATPEGIADGQLLVWDEASGRFLAANPAGGFEIAAASNTTGTVTALSTAGGLGTIVDIPQCSIVVPATSRPVYINYGASIQMTTLGVGVFAATLYEDTTSIDVAPTPLPGSVTVGPNFISQNRTVRLGPTVTERTFKLRCYLWTNAADDAAASVQNSGTSPSFIRAIAQ